MEVGAKCWFLISEAMNQFLERSCFFNSHSNVYILSLRQLSKLTVRLKERVRHPHSFYQALHRNILLVVKSKWTALFRFLAKGQGRLTTKLSFSWVYTEIGKQSRCRMRSNRIVFRLDEGRLIFCFRLSRYLISEMKLNDCLTFKLILMRC